MYSFDHRFAPSSRVESDVMDADRFLSPLNPILIALLHSPLHFIASGGLMTLRYTGRRSGRSITIPVGYQRNRDWVDVLVSKAPRKQWWRNFASPGRVELRVCGKRIQGVAELVSVEAPEFGAAFGDAFARLPFLASQFEVEGYDKVAGLSSAQVGTLAKHGRVVRITLSSEERPTSGVKTNDKPTPERN